MANIFSKFKNKEIPIVCWNFFSSLKEGKETFNSTTWSEWDDKWKSIASNELGDAVIIKDNAIFEVAHGTGEKPKLLLITKDIESLESFFKKLNTFKGFSEKESIDKLKEKKELLKALKKEAPRELKFNFTSVIDDIQETISDLRWLKTKDGKFYQALIYFTKLVYPELRKNGRFEWVIISRNFDKRIFSVGGMLQEGENGDEAIEIIKKYESPLPIEFVDFKPFDEKYT